MTYEPGFYIVKHKNIGSKPVIAFIIKELMFTGGIGNNSHSYLNEVCFCCSATKYPIDDFEVLSDKLDLDQILLNKVEEKPVVRNTRTIII